LFKKTEALAGFTLSDKFESLDYDERLRMTKQLRCMIMYRDVLYDRILAFGEK